MPSVEDTLLIEVFQKYCNFGSRSSLTNEASPGRKSLMMDGSKFAKLIREAGLIDDSLVTLTEVDITFSRVKDKAERRISFPQFRTALKQLADKKYLVGTDNEVLSSKEAEQAVVEVVRKLGGPQLSPGTTMPETSDMIERLMEGPSTYISKTPRDDSRTWKNDLRRTSNTSSRRSSGIDASPASSRKSSMNPATMSPNQLPPSQLNDSPRRP
ncbi:hypothetical protein PSACC_03268 [Paramicrosporidium saccamoebae]|uniref:Uncharacterized protein n=1 Tax=Paramicrosporidium saccamoebae TaxID=1246581 RepID=A0A2H9TGN1_9FUNG|nr:hypothetical protein PSACC_03268 [Paramicrosporidium saccamoebae]